MNFIRSPLRMTLEETIDLACLGVDIDIDISRSCWQTRGRLDISGEGIQVASTNRQSDIANELGWGNLQIRIVRKRLLSLGDTDGQVP